MASKLRTLYIMIGLLSIPNIAFAHGEDSLGGGNTTVSILFFSFLFLLLTSIVTYEIACTIKGNSRKRKNLNKVALISFSLSGILCGLILLYEDDNERFSSLDKGIQLEVIEEEALESHHVSSSNNLEYDSLTPTSGNHINQDAPYGFYPKGKELEILLHNLEYGDIVIYYNDNLEDEEKLHLKELSTLTSGGSGILVVYNPDIESEIVATAWNKKMILDEFNESKISQFSFNHINQGPEKASIERSKKYKFVN